MHRLTVLALVLLAACHHDGCRPAGPGLTPPPPPPPPPRPPIDATPSPPTTVGEPPAFAFPLLATRETAVTIAVGGAHACLLHSGETWCWGRNDWGELGDGTTTSRAAPVRATAVPRAENVVVGAAHSCARTSRGEAWCWGDDELGQVGVPPLTHARPPTRVLGSVLRLAAHGVSTCALLTNRQTQCWGNLSMRAPNPSRAATLDAPTVIGASMDAGYATRSGAFACFLGRDGGVECWGDGVGDSSMVVGPRLGPLRIAGVHDATALGGGDAFFCAAERERVLCWGPNATMFLGLATANETTPEVVPGFGATTSLTVGDRVVCAIAASTDVQCAGWGELVDARGWTVRLSGHAQTVAALGRAGTVSMGSSGGCAVGVDGVVRCVIWRSPDWDQPPSPPS